MLQYLLQTIKKKEIKVPSSDTNATNDVVSKLHKEAISSYSLTLLLFVSELSGTYVD